MSVNKILWSVLSLAALGGAGLLVINAVATLDRGALAGARAALDAGASRVELAVGRGGDDLADLVAHLVEPKELPGQLNAYVRAVASVKPGSDPFPAQQSRIDRAEEKLDEYREAFRAEVGGADDPAKFGVVFVNEVGVVMNSDYSLFAKGSTIDLPPPPSATPAPPPPPVAEGDEEAEPAEEDAPTTFIGRVLAGHPGRTIAVANGKIHYVAAAPIFQGKKKVLGAGLVVRSLSALPATPGAEACMMVGGEATMGECPAGFVASAEASKASFRMVPTQPGAQVMGMELPYMGFLDDGVQQPGIWGRRFAVKGTADAWGYVFSDVSATYGRLRGVQMLVFLMAVALWVFHTVLIFLDGRGMRRGVAAMVAELRAIEGGESEEHTLEVRSLPRAVRKLAKAMNAVLERFVGEGHVKPVAGAPSVDDVLREQHVDGAAPEGDLDFEGISDSGTLDTPKAKSPPPPPPEDIGEPDDGFDSSVADAGEDLFDEAEEAEPLDAVADDAMDELDELDEPKAMPPAGEREVNFDSPDEAAEALFDSSSSGPPPPPDDAGDSLVPNFGDEGDEGATAVMKVTPELLAQMKAQADAEKAAAEPPKPAAPPPKPVPAKPPADEGATAVMKVTPELLAELKAANAEPASAPPPKPAAAAKPVDDEAAHFREVFDAFMETRKKCGEVGDLAYDKFAKRLDQSKAAVMQKHNCSGVRFQVYVKNGKAALKATPAK